MVYKLTEEEKNEYIKAGMAEGLIPIYKDTNTPQKLKQKILEELFDRLTRLEPLKQAIINRRLHYERWLNERGYFGEWDTIEDLTKGKDNTYQFGIASGIYDVCTALLRMVEEGDGLKVKPILKKPTGSFKVTVRVPKVVKKWK